jgi:cell division protein FtsL
MAGNGRKNIRAREQTGIWLILMFFFIIELFFYTWCRVQCIRTGYEISREASKHQGLVTLQNNLRIELARLRSPERIAEIAEQKLGLAMPTSEQLIVIQ